MAGDSFHLDVGQAILAASGNWYKNVQFLGRGGNAVAYLVLATSGHNEGNLFALKVFRRLSDAGRRARFLEEISFLQQCEHPAIMRVYDEGEFTAGQETYPFVVAEYLPSTLAQIPLEAMTITEKLTFTMQLLSAVAFLQGAEQPIVHRDIKPQNIFLKGRSCVLGDFGLMKRLDGVDDVDREVFRQSIGPGMPYRYRTPDLVAYARGEAPLTVKSDVFQLGLVVAELFTGRNVCKISADLLAPVELEKLPFIRGTLGGSLAALIRKMLEFNPAERPLARDLLNPWQRNFMDAVIAAHTLDGEVFSPLMPR
jgi:serine/threonine-protein kinase